MKFRPIILAGGVGSRLWPLSTKSNPKQFIQIFGNYSLFDLTLQRVNNKRLFKKPIIITSNSYLEKVIESQDKTGIELEKIILEPSSKNTCPAVTLGVLTALSKKKDEYFLILPSDHYISSNKQFYTSCISSKKKIQPDQICLFGVKPKYASSDFGYITTSSKRDSFKVQSFIEKPNADKTKKLISNKNVFWNSGIFIFKGSWYIDELRKINANLVNKIHDSLVSAIEDGTVLKPHTQIFNKLEKTSFDKEFVEKCSNIIMFNLDAGWSDVGTWTALSTLHKNSSNQVSLFRKDASKKFERPWGFYEIVMENSFSKVKKITVLPKQKLSLQKHKLRSENWFVIQGKAKVTKGSDKFTLELGDSIIIRRNQTHSLENNENYPLEIIEIQTGDYLGEDDIIRIEDIYGRADLH